jgi:predicted transcriptional regulator
MKTLKVGIASREVYKKRTLAIAKGEYIPAIDEPKVWFESLGTLSQVLSDQNRDLLKLILQTSPRSLRELAESSGRAASNPPGHCGQWSVMGWCASNKAPIANSCHT